MVMSLAFSIHEYQFGRLLLLRRSLGLLQPAGTEQIVYFEAPFLDVLFRLVHFPDLGTRLEQVLAVPLVEASRGIVVVEGNHIHDLINRFWLFHVQRELRQDLVQDQVVRLDEVHAKQSFEQQEPSDGVVVLVVEVLDLVFYNLFDVDFLQELFVEVAREEHSRNGQFLSFLPFLPADVVQRHSFQFFLGHFDIHLNN